MKKTQKQSSKRTTFNRYHSQFVTAAKSHKSAAAKLSGLGHKALEGGATRDVLKDWLIEAGYSKSHANDTVLKFWHEFHGTKPGKKKGPRTDERAVQIFNYAVRKYGKDARNLLLASWKYAKKQASKK